MAGNVKILACQVPFDQAFFNKKKQTLIFLHISPAALYISQALQFLLAGLPVKTRRPSGEIL